MEKNTKQGVKRTWGGQNHSDTNREEGDGKDSHGGMKRKERRWNMMIEAPSGENGAKGRHKNGEERTPVTGEK